MIDTMLRSARDGWPARLAVWLGAMMIVTAAYGFGLHWLMQMPDDSDGADEPLPAIMVELSAEPVAVDTEEPVVSPTEEVPQEVESEEVKPLPEPVMEEKVEPLEPVGQVQKPEVEEEPPEEEVAEIAPQEVIEPEEIEAPEEPEPIVQEVTKVLDNVAIPLPVSRPQVEKVAEKPIEKKKKLRKKPVSTQPSKVVVKAKTRVASTRQINPGDSAKWKSRLLSHLARHKRYPASARRQKEKGIAQVRFRIDDRGNVLSASISRSSGFPDLDRAALAMVQNASPVPVPPSGVSKTITAPVIFSFK